MELRGRSGVGTRHAGWRGDYSGYKLLPWVLELEALALYSLTFPLAQHGETKQTSTDVKQQS